MQCGTSPRRTHQARAILVYDIWNGHLTDRCACIRIAYLHAVLINWLDTSAARRNVRIMSDALQYEDQAIRRVFAISLTEQGSNGSAKPPVIYLQGLAEASTAFSWSFAKQRVHVNVSRGRHHCIDVLLDCVTGAQERRHAPVAMQGHHRQGNHG